MCFLKKYTVYYILIFIFYFANNLSAQDNWISYNDIPTSEGSLPKVYILSSTNSEIVLEISIKDVKFSTIDIENDTYQRFSFPGGGHISEVGNPELPTYSRFLAIPNGTVPQITVIDSNYKEIQGYNVFPAQIPLVDNNISHANIFSKNNNTYSTAEYFPEKIAVLDKPHFIRGKKIVLVVFFPIQYNPVTKTLKAYSQIKLKIRLTPSAQIVEKKKSRYFEPMLNSLLLNYKSDADQITSYKKSTNTLSFNQGGADYLIITHDDFYNEIIPLAIWRNMKGLKVRIATKSDVISAGYTWEADNIFNSSFTGIDGYIKNAYDTWDPAPSFILLVGDADKLPTHYINDHPSGREEFKKIGTDLYYSTMDDNNDLSYIPFPDIFIGRIPAKTSADAAVIVNKIMRYEKSPYLNNPDYYNNVLLAAYDQPGRYFISTSEEIRTFLENEDYTCNTVYTGGSYNGTTQDVIDNINNGCFLVNHRDHGDSKNGPYGTSEGWVHPSFESSDVSSLTYTNFLPIMFSFNCRSGWFDGETDKDNTDPNPIPSCLGETWLKTPDKGGVGFIGSTRISYSGYNDELCKGHYDAIWSNFNYSYSAGYGIDSDYKRYLGHTLNYGKFWMYDKYVLTGGSGYPFSTTTVQTRTEFEEFHVLGDPGLEIWTDVPSQFTNISINVNSTSIEVNTGVTGCTISAYSSDNGESFFEVAYQTSSYTFNTSHRPIYITISKHNYIPYTSVTGGTFTTNQEWSADIKILGNITVASGVTLKRKLRSKITLDSYTITKNGTGSIIIEDGYDNIPDIRLQSGSTIIGLYPTIGSAFNASTTGQYVHIRGTHTFTSHLTIPSGKTLYTEPSSQIKFSSYKYLYVNGTLYGNNTTFTQTSGVWGGIKYQSGSTGSLSNCTINNADYGLYIYNASPTIESNTVGNSIIYLNNSYSHLDDNYFSDVQWSHLVYIYGGAPTFFNNTIEAGDAMLAVDVSNGGDPWFGADDDPPNSFGYNLLTASWMSEGVIWAEGGATPMLGFGGAGPYFCGYNSIISSSGMYPAAAIDGMSSIDAAWCWWGQYPAPECYGDVNTDDALTSDPGGGSSLDKIIPSTNVSTSIIVEQPDEAQLLWQTAMEHYYKQEFQDAVLLLKDIITTYPNTKSAYKSLNLLNRIGRLHKTINSLNTIDELLSSVNDNAMHASLKSKKVQLYRSEGNYDKSVSLCKDIIKENPESLYECYALFDLFNLYQKDIKDTVASLSVLDELKLKYIIL